MFSLFIGSAHTYLKCSTHEIIFNITNKVYSCNLFRNLPDQLSKANLLNINFNYKIGYNVQNTGTSMMAN